jgi:hypothetical protein
MVALPGLITGFERDQVIFVLRFLPTTIEITELANAMGIGGEELRVIYMLL